MSVSTDAEAHATDAPATSTLSTGLLTRLNDSKSTASQSGQLSGRTVSDSRRMPPSAPPRISQEDAVTMLVLYFSAAVHDYDHRGVTNAFLIQDEDPLAVSNEVQE